jgi:uncharacterized protein (TIGR03546 family)
LTDPLAHRIGSTGLAYPWVQPIGAYLFDFPVVPWTALNNTVVLGNLILALVLFYPIYWLSYLFFERYRDRIASKLRQYKAAVVLEKTEPATQWRPQ